MNKQSEKNLKFSEYVITVNKLFLINHRWNNRETRAPVGFRDGAPGYLSPCFIPKKVLNLQYMSYNSWYLS